MALERTEQWCWKVDAKMVVADEPCGTNSRCRRGACDESRKQQVAATRCACHSTISALGASKAPLRVSCSLSSPFFPDVPTTPSASTQVRRRNVVDAAPCNQVQLSWPCRRPKLDLARHSTSKTLHGAVADVLLESPSSSSHWSKFFACTGLVL
jgi:hypothetical protein